MSITADTEDRPSCWRPALSFLSFPWLLFLLSLGLRLLHIAQSGSFREPGQAEVENLALALARGDGFSDPYGIGSGPSAHAAPLYPAFLALLYSLVDLDSVQRKLIQQCASAITSSVLISLLPALSAAFGISRLGGALAGLLLAFSPFQLWVETSGAFEQPYSALALACSVLFLPQSLPSWRTAALVGMGLGMLALLSPSVVLAPALLVAGRALRSRELKRLIIVGGVAALCILPWSIRNAVTFKTFVPIRSNFGLEFFLGNNTESDGTSFQGSWQSDTTFFARHHPFRSAAARERYLAQGEISFMREHAEVAKHWIRENPGPFLRLVATRAKMFFFPPPRAWPESAALRELRAVFYCLITALALVGIVYLARRDRSAATIAMLYSVAPALPYLISHLEPRYRYPVVWLLTLFAIEGARVIIGLLVSAMQPQNIRPDQRR